MDNITLGDMELELEAVRKKTYKQDGDPRQDATAENVARFAELEQQIAAEKEYMQGEDEGAKIQSEGREDEKPTGDDIRSDAQKLEDLTEELRREKLITAAYKAPKGVAIRQRINPDGENMRIDEAMLPALAEAERLGVPIPQALAEGIIDAKKVEVLNKAVERRIRCYVKKAGFHEHPRTHTFTEWAGGLRKGLSAENIAKVDCWLGIIGRVDGDDKPIYEWDTTIVIPNM